MTYFIKTVAPKGYGSQSEDLKEPLEFASGQEAMCDRFAYAAAFFLYEIKGNNKDDVGHQTIYARGSSLSPFCTKVDTPLILGVQEFLIGLAVELDKVVAPKDGIPKVEIDKIKKIRQARGGLIEFTREEFEQINILFEDLGKKRECLCDTADCAKCLTINCKDDTCKVHTQEAKERARQHFRVNT